MEFKPTDKTSGLVEEPGPGATQIPPRDAGERAAVPSVFKVKRILVPVDFSSCSQKALAYAIPFARQFEAELTLLHVLEPYTPMMEMSPVDGETIEEAKKELEGLIIHDIHDAVRSSSVLRRGEPHLEIVKVANELGVDLIILSTHGRSGFERVLLGSTTEKVVRHAGCPVLVVREHEHEFVAESG